MAQVLGKTVSLRALEVFEDLARTGSLQEAAANLGLSAPAASQQIRKLEAALGHALVDHDHRPLILTRAGRAYLVHVREAMVQLRQGSTGLALLDMSSLRRLRFGIIDDFDTDVTPKLVVGLAKVLTGCELSLQTAPSYSILKQIANRMLDIGVAARPLDLPDGITETPLLSEPFLLAVPRGFLSQAPSNFSELNTLAFLRYDRSQLMGRQISTHLTRLKSHPLGGLELDSNQAIFGLIAAGAGWAISTPLGFLRARQFQRQIDIYPLPVTGFSRTVSLFHADDWSGEIAAIIADTMRKILVSDAVEPGHEALPWLAGSLKIIYG